MALTSKNIKIAVLIYIAISFALPQESLAFSNRLIGRPVAKASCEATGCTHTTLDDTQASQSEMVITKAGFEYIWTSREGKLLRREKSGVFDLYKDPSSSDYVKVFSDDEKCLYMEHLQITFQTITYWGTCEEQ